MYRKILVPTDGSRLSDKAIKEALMLAKAGDAKLILFHVVQPYPTPVYAEGMSLPSLPREKIEKISANAARKVLAAAGKKVEAAGVPVSKEWAISSSPHEAIVEIARKRKCNLIVMASSGRSGLSRLILGSVAHAVLAHASIPVLVVR